MTPVLWIVCGWCQVVLRAGTPDASTSHGICPTCTETFEAEIAEHAARLPSPA